MADDDKELFASAMTDAPEIEAPQVEVQEPEPQEQPRDEHGRFTPKAEKPQEQPIEPEPAPIPAETAQQPKAEPKSEGIPPWRLKEEADARRAAEERARQFEQEMAELRRQIAQQQPKQQTPAPNVFEDPDGYTKFVQDQQTSILQQSKLEARFELSETLMRDKVGDEKFDELKRWALQKSTDPAFEAKMMASRHPWGEASRLFEQERVLSLVGSDPNAWFEKQLEERLKDPTHQSKLLERIRGNVQPSQRPVTQLPPSLNKATSAAALEDDGDDNSDAGLLKSALRR